MSGSAGSECDKKLCLRPGLFADAQGKPYACPVRLRPVLRFAGDGLAIDGRGEYNQRRAGFSGDEKLTRPERTAAGRGSASLHDIVSPIQNQEYCRWLTLFPLCRMP